MVKSHCGSSNGRPTNKTSTIHKTGTRTPEQLRARFSCACPSGSLLGQILVTASSGCSFAIVLFAEFDFVLCRIAKSPNGADSWEVSCRHPSCGFGRPIDDIVLQTLLVGKLLDVSEFLPDREHFKHQLPEHRRMNWWLRKVEARWSSIWKNQNWLNRIQGTPLTRRPPACHEDRNLLILFAKSPISPPKAQ